MDDVKKLILNIINNDVYHPWNLDLWKVCIPIENKQQLQDFNPDDDKMLYPTNRVRNVFPDNPPEAYVHLMIKTSCMSLSCTLVQFPILSNDLKFPTEILSRS